MAIDYRSFSENGSGQTPSVIDRRWWLLKKSDLPAAITSLIGFLQQHQGARQTQIIMSARLYGNLSVMGLNGLTYSKIATVQAAIRDRITYNVCQSAVDTVCSKIGKNKPRPLFLTSGGDYRIQRRAKKLTKFTDGIFYENNAYKLGLDCFRDGAIWGTGLIYVYREKGRVKWERALPSEMYVDEVEGFYGEPRQIHRVKNIDRQVLLDCFPERRSVIERADRATPDNLGGYENISDVITVRESWHLPSGPDAGDGLHTITIHSGELFTEEYTRDHFPFAKFDWCKRLFGYWGQGGVEQIQNYQLEINKLLWVIQRSMHLAGSFKVWLKNGSKVSKDHINNDLGTIITGEEAPQYLVPPIVAPEVYAHLQTLKNGAFEQFGISQLSAASKKPDGLDSGKALREFNDIESDRFMTIGQAYEDLFMQLAKLSIEEAREIAEEDGDYEVVVPGKKFTSTINWKDIDLEEDQYVMKCYPVSSLPNDPAGRLQTIQEYAQAGYLSPRTARRLLDFPDLEQEESLANAQEDYLTEILERIVDEGEYTAPEPYDGLELALEMGLEFYAQGKCNNLEEERLDLLRQFIDQVNLLKNPPVPPPAPPMGVGGGPGVGAAPANPEAAPVSDLVPNVPVPAVA
jgi:hypothetical protein